MEIKYSVPCPDCGGTGFPFPDNTDDDSFVTCDQCGLEITVSDLREHGLEHAKEYAVDKIRAEIKKKLCKYFK